MSTLTARQKRAIDQTIRDHHLAFAAEVLGADSISAEDYTRLVEAKKIRTKPAIPVDAATAAHVIGTLTGTMTVPEAETFEAGSFWRIMREAPPTLTTVEREAIAVAKARIGEHIKGLGNKLDAATGHILIDADDAARRRKLLSVRHEVASGIETRKTAREIAQAIKAKTGDLKRDWLQIAQTELHNAVEEGKAAALVASVTPGSDPLVFKRPRPDACPFCVLLYLMPDKLTPRVFRLSELLSNGSNVGRRAGRPAHVGESATSWKATLGALHPWCQCGLHHLPEGMGFDAGGRMVYFGAKKAIVTVDTLSKALLFHKCATG